MACVINVSNMNKSRFLKITLVALLIALGAWLIFKAQLQSTSTEENKIKVVTTIFPLYDIAEKVGGSRVSVLQLLPPGVEAHHFEPRPNDLLAINQAQVFVYAGKIMEPWAEKVLQGVRSDKLQVVDASAKISLLAEDSHEHEDDEHDNNNLDPHFWLDFDNMKIMVDEFTQALIVADPDYAEEYQMRARAYREQLTILDQNYKDGLQHCDSRQMIYGGHYAFGYLAQRYHLEHLTAQGLSPDAEPTARELIILSLKAKANTAPYIFYEELDNPKVAQTIAQESGAQLLSLHTAHNLSAAQRAEKLSFVDIMKTNLTNLRQGLACK